MPTAPSFSSYAVISEPFEKDGKQYIKIKNSKTSNERTVRWYSESEYARLYGAKSDTSISNMKQKYGFEKGPILVVRRNRIADEEYLRRSDAHYILGIGWYFPSTCTLPSDTPAHFKYLLLGWDEFKQDETHPKPTKNIAAILDERARKNQWIKFAQS